MARYSKDDVSSITDPPSYTEVVQEGNIQGNNHERQSNDNHNKRKSRQSQQYGGQYGGQQYGGQQYGGQQYGGQQYGGQQYGEQQYAGQPNAGQQYGSQPNVIYVQGQPNAGQPYSGQQSAGQPQVIIVQQAPTVVVAEPVDPEVMRQIINYFENPEDRKRFIAKVYVILTIQLLFMFGVVSAFSFVPVVSDWVKHNEYTWSIFAISITLYICGSIAMCCCTEALMHSPQNYIICGMVAIGLSGMTAFMAAQYAPRVVVISIGATLVAFLLLTALACCVPYDFTPWTMGAIVCMFVIFIFAIVAGFLVPNDQVKTLNLVLGCVITCLLCVWIIIDTQSLMSGKKYNLSPDMHVFAATMLFIDVALLFQYIMCILQGGGVDN